MLLFPFSKIDLRIYVKLVLKGVTFEMKVKSIELFFVLVIIQDTNSTEVEIFPRKDQILLENGSCLKKRTEMMRSGLAHKGKALGRCYIFMASAGWDSTALCSKSDCG